MSRSSACAGEELRLLGPVSGSGSTTGCGGPSVPYLAERSSLASTGRAWDVQRRWRLVRGKFLPLLRAQLTPIAFSALVCVRSHREVAGDDAFRRPLYVPHGGLDRLVVNWHLDALAIAQEVNGPGAGVGVQYVRGGPGVELHLVALVLSSQASFPGAGHPRSS